MKRLACLVALVLSIACVGAQSICVDTYDLFMRLKVPVVVDNMQSRGRRVYKWQSLRGSLVVYYYDKTQDPYLVVPVLYNKDYKIRGEYVSYKTTVSDVLWRAIGDNKTDVFKTAAFGFKLDADPSYNVGDDEPDNTLILTLAGNGTVTSVSGFVSGQLGCGCAAYGHKSPTRIVYVPYVGSKWIRDVVERSVWRDRWKYETVGDIAPCGGRWKIKFRDRSYVSEIPE